MGILHSTSRFFGRETEDDEDTPIYNPYHCNRGGDSSSVRSSACSSIFNAILQGFRFLFCCLVSPTETPNDLPIQNSIREPLLSQPRDRPHFFHQQWQLEKQQRNRDVVLSIPGSTNAAKSRCGIVDYLSYQRLRTEKEERDRNVVLFKTPHSIEGRSKREIVDRDRDLVLPIPGSTRPPSYKVKEEIASSSTVSVRKDPPRNVTILRTEKEERDRNVVLPIPELKTPHCIEGRSKCEIVDVSTYQKKQRNRDLVLPIPGSTRPPSNKVNEIASSSTLSVRKDPPRNITVLGTKKAEKVSLIKNSSAIIIEERWIKHYSNRHRILLVGDGDFSFSASLAVAFSSASNIIATSLDSEEFLKKNYFKAASNIEKLRGRGSKVMHEVDATQMANHPSLQHLKFDRIIFNFPYAGLRLKNLPRDSQLRCHKRLVDEFLKNAREMISENGEIHISHKTNSFHADFNLESTASSHRLRLIEAVRFNCSDYPGYYTKCGFGGDNNFHCYPSKTYKFGIKKLQYY